MFRTVFKFPSQASVKIYRNGIFEPTKKRLNQTVRQYVKTPPPYCPPPKENASTGFAYTVGAFIIATGGAIVYAKYDPEFRKLITDNVPYSDIVFDFLFQENPYVQQVESLLDDTTKKLKDTFSLSSPEPEVISKAQTIPNLPLPSLTDEFEDQNENKEENITDDVSLKRPIQKTIVKGTPSSQSKPAAKPDTVKSDTSILETPMKLVEIEDKASKVAQVALSAYKEANDCLQTYTDQICKLIDESFDKSDRNIWNKLKTVAEEKNKHIQSAENLSKQVMAHVDEFKVLAKTQGLKMTDPVFIAVKDNIKRIETSLIEAKHQLDMNREKISIADKYWSQIEEARKHFIRELEILFPNVQVSDKKIDIEQHDFDLFILHAYHNIMYYQKELSKMETLAEVRLKRALDAARKEEGADTELINEKIFVEVEKEKRNLMMEFQKKAFEIRSEAEKEMRMQLKRQSEAHVDHLKDALKVREEELTREFTRKIDEELVKEKLEYKTQLASMIGRLKGVDDALKARADADRSAHQAQALWGACQALHQALRGAPCVPGKVPELRSLTHEISAVKKATIEGDELVEAMLEGIPSEATSRGLYGESALRDRFHKVERTARRLALVPAEGARLPVYALSFVQSLLVVDSLPAARLTVEELNDERMDFSQMSTFDVLSRARYWLERGDLAQTLRYMNLLKGAPRVVAADWMYEAKILLETQQAVNALMSHSAALGLLYL